jgi:hypothetical protein
LHVRYTKETFPEDLMFQQTSDKQNFQTRYVLRHAFAGSPTACDVAKQYYEGVAKRQEKEAQQLASLTGWSMASVREKMPYMQSTSSQMSQGWWKDLWVQ